MTNKERIICAIQHKQTDFVPYSVGFVQQERERVAEFLNDPNFMDHYNNPIVDTYYSGSHKEISSGYFKDDFGVVWNRNGVDKDIGMIDGLVLPEPSLSNYTFPIFDEAAFRANIENMLAEHPNDFKLCSIGFSMFERAWSLRGMENVMMDMIDEPEFVDELLDAITAYNLKIINIALEYEIDGFMFGDDWGQQTGLIMGPIFWRRFIKPRISRMYQQVKSKGKFVFQHSCGDLREIFSDLIEIGLDVYQTFQPEIYDMKKVKAEVGDKLTFWGGISTQRLLPYATPDEIKRVVKETLEIMKVNGGYIVAPTHSIPGDVPPENVMAMLEAFEHQ